jgi:hypothetical protein
MSRLPDPGRLHAARRAAVVERLGGERVLRDQAEGLVAAWEVEADRLGIERGGQFWIDGWTWISRQRGVDPDRLDPATEAALDAGFAPWGVGHPPSD